MSPGPRGVLGQPTRLVLLVLGALLVAGLVLLGQGADAPSDRDASPGQVATAGVAVDDLPVAARRTVALILAGGPFPYPRDGSTFGNRERLLPVETAGYYREFTVPTPGSRDRGARRIVLGGSGEMFYTADHYRSFTRIDLSTRE